MVHEIEQQLWPRSLTIDDVADFKSKLIQIYDVEHRGGDLDLALAAASGASSWEWWLLERDQSLPAEVRVRSALDLAIIAGDVLRARLIIQHAQGRPDLRHKRFVRDADRAVAQQVEANRRTAIGLADDLGRLPMDARGGADDLRHSAGEARGKIAPSMVNWALARVALAEADGTREERHLRLALLADPGLPDVAVFLAHAMRDRSSDVIAMLRRANAIYTANFRLAFMLAHFSWQLWLQHRLGQPPHAEIDRAVSLLSPEELRAWPGYALETYALAGFLAIAGGDLERAATTFLDGAAKLPQHPILEIAAASALLKSNDRTRAIETLDRVIRRAAPSVPGVGWAYLLRSTAALEDEDVERAHALLQRSLAQPDRTETGTGLSFNQLGVIQTLIGDFAGARRSFEQALAIVGAGGPVTQNLAAIGAADVVPEVTAYRIEALVDVFLEIHESFELEAPTFSDVPMFGAQERPRLAFA